MIRIYNIYGKILSYSNRPCSKIQLYDILHLENGTFFEKIIHSI